MKKNGNRPKNHSISCWHVPHGSRAGQKLNRQHQKLVTFFENRHCHRPEEYADRTIDRVARKLDEGLELTTEDPWMYFLTVAGYILMEYWNDMKKDPVPMDELPEAAFHPRDEKERKKKNF